MVKMTINYEEEYYKALRNYELAMLEIQSHKEMAVTYQGVIEYLESKLNEAKQTVAI